MKKHYSGWWNSPVRLMSFSWDPKRESIEDAVKRFKERGGKVIALK
jgi:DNA-binding MurR/RpiR family transcriptional regulator